MGKTKENSTQCAHVRHKTLNFVTTLLFCAENIKDVCQTTGFCRSPLSSPSTLLQVAIGRWNGEGRSARMRAKLGPFTLIGINLISRLLGISVDGALFSHSGDRFMVRFWSCETVTLY